MYTIREIIKSDNSISVSEPRDVKPNGLLLSWRDKSRLKGLCDPSRFAKYKFSETAKNNVEIGELDATGQADALSQALLEIACIIFGLSLSKDYVAEDMGKLIEYVEDRDFLGLKIEEKKAGQENTSMVSEEAVQTNSQPAQIQETT